ncbi:arylamine N-acetyltransferase [Virgibacillus salarius]|uniref:arylamine N-acetyltransferase family protein n=1 Tax=Virgibacillus salarius TaxID=447199 RepID=UPI0031D7A341
MNHFINGFFKRIKYNGSTHISFNDIPTLMFQFAKHIPFENLDVINNERSQVSKHTLQQKLLDNPRGGLCYELNPLFYYVLREVGYNVKMIAASIILPKNGLQGTHISTILTYDERTYIVDVGFGSHLALQPIPLTGETISSRTGNYRIVEQHDDKAIYALEKITNGKIEASYTFTLDAVDEEYLTKVKEIIKKDERSPFNRSILVTKLTEEGHITLTKDTITEIRQGIKNKQEINPTVFQQLLANRFGIHGM